ncbi:MAG TPA: DNA polymerase IV, partial [Lachnospiraceae bacterium]|nr:DNA polymerase IV [Lachnospiraceae bacterium]
MSDRIILHVDCNCFYASVEMLYHPELAGKPLAVGGDPEERHGIVLTANYIAKRQGVKTGMALWQARQCCPNLVFVPPRMYLYLRFSRMARSIYQEYSDKVESFGLDECWIDLTESCAILGDHTRTIENGYRIAQEISRRIRRELGITVSIGVSWNKIYAKLGSDYKKPDAITVFDRDNYRKLIDPLPVSDLLYVGRRTGQKLAKYGIRTIGQL